MLIVFRENFNLSEAGCHSSLAFCLPLHWSSPLSSRESATSGPGKIESPASKLALRSATHSPWYLLQGLAQLGFRYFGLCVTFWSWVSVRFPPFGFLFLSSFRALSLFPVTAALSCDSLGSFTCSHIGGRPICCSLPSCFCLSLFFLF